jgi:hypothetical protein
MSASSIAPPARLRAGDSIGWYAEVPAYPSGHGWSLSYRLIGAAGIIDLTATAEGPVGWRASVDATDSAAWAPGDYDWLALVSRDGERYSMGGGGVVTVLPDLAAATTAQDTRTTAARALADLRAALAIWLATDGHVTEYEIAGRRIAFADAGELRARISLLEAEVAREAQAARLADGLEPRRRLLVRF